MAQPKPLSDQQANGFAEGAARFAEIARSVKAQQIAEQQGTAQAFEPAATPPDEIWARNFMSRSIGPSGVEAAASLAPRAVLPPMAPDFAALRSAERPTEFVRKPDLGVQPRILEGGAPQGFGAGRHPPVRRSWLARLFGRS